MRPAFKTIAGWLIGDDAAAYFANNEIQLATVDSLVQDVHFSLSYMSWQETRLEIHRGQSQRYRSNGRVPSLCPRFAGLPPDTEVENIIDLYRGMFDIAGNSVWQLSAGIRSIRRLFLSA